MRSPLASGQNRKREPEEQEIEASPEAASRPQAAAHGAKCPCADDANKNPTLQNNAKIHSNNGPKQQLNTLPAVQSNNAPYVKPNKLHAYQVHQNKLPAVQSNKFQVNKNVKNFQPKHQNFHAQVNSSVASVHFNQNFHIKNAQNWNGAHYTVFKNYHPQWHDHGWWHSHHNHILLIGGGWYYWNAGYWYPAWGYDESAAYYPYDGPIYVGNSPKPFDQIVADVQTSLQEQGLYNGEIDGLVGPLTQEALAAYQSAQGLEQTAAIDQPTLESLGMG